MKKTILTISFIFLLISFAVSQVKPLPIEKMLPDGIEREVFIELAQYIEWANMNRYKTSSYIGSLYLHYEVLYQYGIITDTTEVKYLSNVEQEELCVLYLEKIISIDKRVLTNKVLLWKYVLFPQSVKNNTISFPNVNYIRYIEFDLDMDGEISYNEIEKSILSMERREP